MAEEAKQAEGAASRLEDLVAKAETGARQPPGAVGALLFWVAVAWSLFQLWYASPLPFMLRAFVLNATEARSIHLAFAVFLTFMAYPALSRSPRDRVPLLDWTLALVGAFCAAYLYLFYEALAGRPGQPTTYDIVVAVAGMILLLEATRRALGPPLTIVALIFLVYTFGGPWMPDVIAHGGASLRRVATHQWLTTAGVFGIALGVSTSFVFLFVLFGSLLDKAGAGNYFIKVAFSLLGHLRGGPAKAAVLSSGLTGLISGSSIANVVTTGTFTIPLMKRVGFRPEAAGAVEVAASVNGQIMPPVMGAAAFLMVEYVGIPYIEVIRHAFLPAIISYVALLYITHLEAMKAGMQGLPKARQRTLLGSLLVFGITAASIIILAGLVYYGIGWIKAVAGDASGWVITVLLLAAYVVLIAYAARYPELEVDDPDAPVVSLPETAPTLKSGLHFILPVVVLVWALIVERLSPGLSAFWATLFMIFVLLTQHPLFAFFRGRHGYAAAVRRGFDDLLQGLAAGARNMVGIGIATAAAGIIVGTVSLTGIGLVMTELVEVISGGNLMLMLLFTALISLVLGMGLPTTANYIVVATLMAPVIVNLGAQNGLLVPLIAVHLFVFYYGIMADVTPPVGLASFAAAAISGGDPMRTGLTASYYSLRTAVLPFLFIFNTELLMIGIESIAHFLVTVGAAMLAMLLFAAGTQGWFLARNRLWEAALLLLVSFTLFRPGFWMDSIYPPYEEVSPTRIEELMDEAPPDSMLRVVIRGINLSGNEETRTVRLPLGETAPGAERLAATGLELREEEGRVLVDMVQFGSLAEQAGFDFDYEILTIEMPTAQPEKQWMFIPALLVLALVVVSQRRRAAKAEAVAKPGAAEPARR